MITLRPAAARGQFDHGWLDTRHTFSFADYYDPAQMGFRALRVINEDRITPGAGFPTHPHRDMEIVTYVLAGALEHKDSLGTGSVIRPGDAQRMSAGTGIRHSEFNHSRAEGAHFLQIWIVPERAGLAPGYEQKSFAPLPRGALRLLASRDGRDGAITVHQDVDLWVAPLDAGQAVALPLRPGRHAWVQVTRGAVTLNGQQLGEGDGAAVSDEGELHIAAPGAPGAMPGAVPAEVLVFDLA